MNIVLLIDPLPTLKAYKDSSVAIMRAAAQRGHQVYVAQPADLFWQHGQVMAQLSRLSLHQDTEHWYSVEDTVLRPIAESDVVLMRKDPPFDAEYLYATQLLSLAESAGARVYNAPQALRDFNEKLAIARFPQFTVPTLVSCRAKLLREFARTHADVILKPLDGMGGMEVFRVRPDGLNLNAIIESLTRQETRTIMAQCYIPEIIAGDKRILLIDGVPIPWALARMPAPGETRANLAAGGHGVAQPLSARDLDIAHTVGASLRDVGLMLVGLDVIGDYLTEINVTSPTGMVEIADQTGYSVADTLLDAIESRSGD